MTDQPHEKEIVPAHKPPDGHPPATLAVGVQFQTAGKIYTFTTTDPELALGTAVMVESDRGAALGTISRASYATPEAKLPRGVKRVLRRASPEEIDADYQHREEAMGFMGICNERIRKYNLEMKLLDAQLEENGRKVVFLFFSEQRIDFRSLVKDLAATLKKRIEMRQVGARDEAKATGCMGSCGMTTCCSTHLRQFQSISIAMAKHQGLSPNPAKLTGMCGKLKCCLAYEHAVYAEYRQGLPKIGAAVETPKGAGRIIGHSVLKRECVVRLYGGAGEMRCPCEQCKVLSQEEREAAITSARENKAAADARTRERASERARKRKGGARTERKDRPVRKKSPDL